LDFLAQDNAIRMVDAFFGELDMQWLTGRLARLQDHRPLPSRKRHWHSQRLSPLRRTVRTDELLSQPVVAIDGSKF